MTFVLPDIEALTSQHFRADVDVVAYLGQHVYTDLPKEFDGWPAARITRIGGSPVVGHPLWVDAAVLQIEVWGGPKRTALEAAETCRQSLQQMRGVHPEGVCTGVTYGSLSYLPDETFTPARPRYLFLATVRARPLTSDTGS